MYTFVGYGDAGIPFLFGMNQDFHYNVGEINAMLTVVFLNEIVSGVGVLSWSGPPLSMVIVHHKSSGQVRSECLMCTFRASCCSARLSRAQVPSFAGFFVRDRWKKGGVRGGGVTACTGGYKGCYGIWNIP